MDKETYTSVNGKGEGWESLKSLFPQEKKENEACSGCSNCSCGKQER